MNKINTIPNEISYYYGNQIEVYVGSRYDSNKLDFLTKKYKNNVQVYHAFPILKQDEKEIQQAIQWVQGWNKNPYFELKIKNKNIQLNVCHTEHRKNNLVFKVYHEIENKKFFFDLREDVAMDVMLNEGCREGKFLCSFVWARLGAQNRLIRVGSKLYNDFYNIK